MRAVVFEGTRAVSVREVPDPELERPTDVVVRVTSSAVCGTDLHMYDGRIGAEPGLVLGHEPVGVVERAGDAVTAVSVGDRVVLPTHLYCGVCGNCARRLTAACTRVRPGAFGAAYGYAGMGPYRGAQAELLRVPFADANCVPLPGEPGDAYEDAFVLLADAFVTGWHATELAGVRPGDSVAVFGAGTVGLLAAHSALLRGAAEVYVVDRVAERLAVAEGYGAVPVDFTEGDPGDLIRAHRKERGLPPGEESMDGVQRGIDAVGFQADSRRHPGHEDPRQVIHDLARLVNPTGGIGVAGVFAARDEDPARNGHGDGSLRVPWATLFDKGISVGFGRTHDRRYTALLRDMILAGRAEPQRVVTHHGTLDQASSLYGEFDHRTGGVVKAVLRP
ncbi:glutathione-independent formaldehyde dehydrogenase [Streptomyces iconiensis]|uniref:Glutathione-independent formaldehyde dehydrogenase n=1 Tax=Streptomyces iconiensis TaxID=1384038 RepID=A0ABT7ACF5_9ACTN|nr:glutathione-independent formaldehyde dehydrogenase [Streptomyces iconiensis]MDJ1138491.1 glutathione-independent formaldehyde dehydrogenase [Streptomyces iconiensis]